MTRTEKMINILVKKSEEMELLELITLAHDKVNEYYGSDFDVTIQKAGSQWKIVDYNTNYEVICATLKKCYEALYEDTLYKIFKDDIENEYEEMEEIDRKEREKIYWAKQLYANA